MPQETYRFIIMMRRDLIYPLIIMCVCSHQGTLHAMTNKSHQIRVCIAIHHLRLTTFLISSTDRSKPNIFHIPPLYIIYNLFIKWGLESRRVSFAAEFKNSLKNCFFLFRVCNVIITTSILVFYIRTLLPLTSLL